jgi:hypothetical protein
VRVFTTNYVYAAQDFRDENGRLYDINRSIKRHIDEFWTFNFKADTLSENAE